MPLIVERKIGKYRIRRELGRGGMGVVYLAVDETLDREVALKIIRPGLHIEERGIARFKREARSAAALSHPHVAHVNALDEIDGQLVIEMPYLSGGSLRDRVRAGMSLGALARTLDQVLQALECCHAAGIIHRDVKPSNILFDNIGFAKLSDFGAATLAAEEFGASVSGDVTTFVGTPRYACPESWDQGSPTPSWDLFSLGVLAWEAVAGELPNSNLSPWAFLRQLNQKPLPPLREAVPEVSEELAGLINSLCAHNSEDRPASAADARQRLLCVPELEGYSTSNDMTAQIRRRRRTLRSLALRDHITRTIERTRRLSIPVILSLLAGVALTAWWYAEFSPRSGAAPLPDDQIVRTQAEVVRASVPDPDDIIAAVRSPDGVGPRTYDAITAGRPDSSGKFLLSLDSEGGSGMGLVDENVLLLKMTSNGENSLRVQGIWGTYRGAKRRALLFGRVEGQAYRSEGANDSLRFALNYGSDVTIESWDETIVAFPSISTDTDSAIAYAWEQDEIALPVLTRELLPRFDEYLDVARAFLPTLSGAWVDATVLSPNDVFTFDGALDEAFWRDAQAVISIPANRLARLSVICTDTELILGGTLDVARQANDVFSLMLMPGYDVPSGRSGVLDVRISAHGVEGSWTVRDIAVPVNDLVEMKTSASGPVYQFEVRIPFEAIGREFSPFHGEVFRLNARLNPNGNTRDALVWGWPETPDVAHGLLVRFAAQARTTSR